MSVQHLYCDSTEIIAMIPKKKAYASVNLRFNNITRIEIGSYTKKVFFLAKKIRFIKIYTNINHGAIEFLDYKEKKYFDSYAEELSKFARNNKIRLDI